ncbi:hypothetical protein CW304_01470 [Bacillus sp. UFRGS-B20]|nr:hypothetical protein CW304_01470 [Bacillus sp. UFRGS-B20]
MFAPVISAPGAQDFHSTYLPVIKSSNNSGPPLVMASSIWAIHTCGRYPNPFKFPLPKPFSHSFHLRIHN